MAIVILKRTGTTLLVVWGAVTLIFVLVRLAPGDPAVALLGPTATGDQLEALRAQLGLNEPIWNQYLIYIGDIFRGNFGESIRLGKPAIDAVLERLPATLELTLAAAIIAVAIGIPLGAYAARRVGGVADRIISGAALFVKSVPGFWLGIMLILVFAGFLRLLPSFGSGTPLHIVLPAVTLGLPFAAIVTRLMRSSVVETLEEPFVQTARSKGLLERVVMNDHVVRNSLIPVTTVIGLQVGTLLGGAVVIESVFAWPGIGALLVESVAGRDYTVVQTIAFVVAILVVVLNLLTDLLYVRLDPRIRLGAAR